MVKFRSYETDYGYMVEFRFEPTDQKPRGHAQILKLEQFRELVAAIKAGQGDAVCL